MTACWELPEGYRLGETIDLQKDKKKAVFVNVAAVVVFLVLAVILHLFVPVTALFDMEDGAGVYFLRFGVLIAADLAYIVLHELVHGVFIRKYSGKKAKYGFTGLYAFAGSDAYFVKKPYEVIAFAPVVVWGIVFLVLCLFLRDGWLWVVYLLEAINLSGAMGDFYVCYRLRAFPEETLIRDRGTAMELYLPEK